MIEQKPKKRYITGILMAPVIVAAWTFIFAFIHEVGHVLVVWMYGGRINSFVIFSFRPHITHIGADFTEFGQALSNASGMLLPVLLGIIAVCFYDHRIKSIPYHISFFLAAISLPFSIVPWVIFPIVSLYAFPPRGDDVTKFIDITRYSFNPLCITFVALMLIWGFIMLSYRRGIYEKVLILLSSK